MRRWLLAFAFLLAVGVLFAAYNVWRADNEPVSTPPGPLELGRAHLQAQLDEAKQREARFEQQDWNSPELLRGLIAAHQARIDKLKDNREAAGIVAYDRAEMDKLEKRIAEIAAQREAAAEAAAAAGEAPEAAGPETAGPDAGEGDAASPATVQPRPAAASKGSTAQSPAQKAPVPRAPQKK